MIGDDFQLANATNYVNFLDEIFPYLGIESSSAAAVSAAASTGPDVADLNSFLQKIGLGSLVANNDFMLATDFTLPIGQWLVETTSIALFNELNGLDASSLTTALIVDLSPAGQDLGDILNGTGDLATNLSQLMPDITQGLDGYAQAVSEIFLSV